MPLIIKKREKASGATGEPDNMNRNDKLSVLKTNFVYATKYIPDYDELNKEISEYNVELPSNYDVPNISEINKLYAITQSYISRVTTIEAIAISNLTRWSRLKNIMESYIIDCECELLTKEDVKALSNVKLQQAEVHRLLKKQHTTLDQIKDKEAESDSFRRVIELKKKDLTLILTNLNRQVHALGLEKNMNF